jgi:hypothetical protein
MPYFEKSMLCGSLRISASSALNYPFNAEDAEYAEAAEKRQIRHYPKKDVAFATSF